jgi:hypothetical protein
MRDRLAKVDDGFLERGVKIPEASLPSWLSEAALKKIIAALIAELTGQIPVGQGLELTDPEGKSWTISIENDGALIATLND